MAKTGRLEIRAEDDFLARLDGLARASGTSKADVIHRAIGLYAQALKEAEEGRVIKFVPKSTHDSSVRMPLAIASH
jgi:hypothetical protein